LNWATALFNDLAKSRSLYSWRNSRGHCHIEDAPGLAVEENRLNTKQVVDYSGSKNAPK
jgi:hypothetical protein